MDSFLFYEHHLNQALVRLISEQVRKCLADPGRASAAQGSVDIWYDCFEINIPESLRRKPIAELSTLLTFRYESCDFKQEGI